jgi:hypothetical protein
MTAPATAHPRFATALARMGLDELMVRAFPEETRAASQAAKAIPCNVNQIVKSLGFEVDDEPLLVLVDGPSRVDTALVSGMLGARRVRKATPGTLRSVTGCAGTPHTVFTLTPGTLLAPAGATVADVAERSP